jgi:hypothetical protein
MRGKVMAMACIGLLVATAPAWTAAAPGTASLAFTIATVGGGTEPSIASSGDGYVYVVSPNGFPGPSNLWRSHDDGATWQALDAITNVGPLAQKGLARGTANGGEDADVAVDPAAAVYFMDLSVADAAVASSDDHGATWARSTPASGPPADDRQWLAAPEPGVAYAASETIGLGLWVTKSTDGGQTFLLSTLLPNPDRGLACCAAPGGPLAANPAAPRTLALGLENFDTSEVLVDITQDAGARWGVSTITGSNLAAAGTNFPPVAVDAAGNVYAAWTQVEDGVLGVDVAVKPFGQPWSAPARVVGSGTSLFPWIAANGAGHVALAYYHTTAASTDPNTVGSGAVWDVEVAENFDAVVSPGAFGAPFVLDARVHDGNLSNALGARPLGDFFEVDTDPAGHVLVSWANDVGHGAQSRAAVQAGGPLL